MIRSDSALEHVTPYDRFAWRDSEIERFLLTGEHRQELAAYFGTGEYRALLRLAQQAQRASPPDPATVVLIVPGIMGSQLGLLRRRPLPDDILWLDPIDIGVGRLAALRVPAKAPIVPLGVVLFSHLRLKLQLRKRGFNAKFHDYDWRCSIEELGNSLAERIRVEPCERVMIVGHSMGGLVGRAALHGRRSGKIERLILLGTPNIGSFAPLQALRGTYAVVRKIAQLVNHDGRRPSSSAESLASEIFSSFPSLYQMLPSAACAGGVNLFDSRQWPTSGPQPDLELLHRGSAIHAMLALDDERMRAIVGIGQETVTAAVRRRDDFLYTVTRRGDGTVPAASAAIPGARNYFAAVPHSELTRDPVVAAAIADLLRHGTTRRLAARWLSHSRAEAHITDRQLRRLHRDKVDWAGLEPQQRREFLQSLNEPPKLRLRIPSATPCKS